MKKLIVTTLLGGSLLLVGCGSSSSSFSDDKETETKTEIVEAGEIITVSSGDTIQQSDDAEIIIRHVIETDSKEIEVLSGSISLVKGNFSVE